MGERGDIHRAVCHSPHVLCGAVPPRDTLRAGCLSPRLLSPSELGLASHASPESPSLLPSSVVADIRFHRGQEVSLEFLRHIK